MHPFMYSKGFVHRAKTLRNNKSRNIRVLYAGSRGGGSHALLTARFGVDSREDALQYVRNSAAISHFVVQELGDLAEDHRRDILLAVREIVDIPQEQLLEAMSRSSFFLALPGWIVPFSHNLTEAMSVGAVPILQYASLLPIPLRDGENCLTYSHLSDLDKVVDRALKMSEIEIARVRTNVIDYYDRYLSTTAVKKIVNDCKSETIALMGEQNSVLP